LIDELLRSSSHNDGFNSSNGLFNNLGSDRAQDGQKGDNTQDEDKDTEGNDHPSDGGSHYPSLGASEIDLIESNLLLFNIENGIVMGQEHSSENEGIDFSSSEISTFGFQR